MTRRRAAPDGWRFLELLGLASIGVTQSVLSAMGQSPERFLAVGAGRVAIVLFAVTWAVAPALALWCVGVGLGVVHPRVASLWHAASAGLLLAVAVMLGVREWTSFGWSGAVAIAAVSWVAGAVLVEEVPGSRLWARYLSPVAPISVAVLLFVSPVSGLVLPASGATAGTPPGNGAPVFVLVFDELGTSALLDRTGAIDRARFPAFAALADDATWYRNATTVHSYTNQAVPAILTGGYPGGELTAPTVARYPRNLFTLLADGYRLDVHEHFAMCPAAECGSRRRGLVDATVDLARDAARTLRDQLVPEATPAPIVHGFDADVAPTDVAAFDEMLDRVVRGERETLHFVHVLLPHGRFQYLPSGRRYADPSPYLGMQWDDANHDLAWAGEGAASQGQLRHRLQLQLVDRLVGRLVARLRALDLYDDALVVVTADHGVSFRAGTPHRAVTDANATDILWVPLLVKAPDQTRGVRSDAPVESVDVLPTIASALEMRLPWELDGVRAGTRIGGRKHFTAAWNGERSSGGLDFDGDGAFRRMLDEAKARPSPDAPFVRVLGRRVDELARSAGGEVRVALDEPGAWDAVDPSAAVLPAAVVGTIVGGPPAPAVVVVALDGVLVAGAETFAPDGDSSRFVAMLPEASLTAGAHRVEVYLLGGTATHPALAPVAPVGR